MRQELQEIGGRLLEMHDEYSLSSASTPSAETGDLPAMMPLAPEISRKSSATGEACFGSSARRQAAMKSWARTGFPLDQRASGRSRKVYCRPLASTDQLDATPGITSPEGDSLVNPS